MKYYTRGVTGYVDIHDVILVMMKLMNDDISGERFIVSSENLSYQEVFRHIALALGKEPPVRHAAKLHLGLAWRLDWIRARLLRSERRIPREAVHAGSARAFFSNAKVKAATGIRFKTAEQSIRETAEIFLREMNGRGT